MPFTLAYIEEVLRISCPVNKIIDHKTQAEVELGEYVLPKGAIVSISLRSLYCLYFTRQSLYDDIPSRQY